MRLESPQPFVRLPPSEVIYSSDDGKALLIHLPTLTAVPMGSPNLPSGWKSQYGFGGASEGVSVGIDGSTRWDGRNQSARYAVGAIAPIAAPSAPALAFTDTYPYPTLQRRRVRQRSLCQWNEETALVKHLGTPKGFIDIDPDAGLFALNLAQPASPFPVSIWPNDPGVVVPTITVGYQEGYTNYIGARPAPREALLGTRLKRPTRLIVGDGFLHANAPADARHPPVPVADERVRRHPGGPEARRGRAVRGQRDLRREAHLAGRPAIPDDPGRGAGASGPPHRIVELPRRGGHLPAVPR